MDAAAIHDQLAVDLAGIVAKMARLLRLADAGPKAQPFQLRKLGVGCAALAFMPGNGKSPMGQTDVETVKVHGVPSLVVMWGAEARPHHGPQPGPVAAVVVTLNNPVGWLASAVSV